MSFASFVVCSATLAMGEMFTYSDKPVLWFLLLATFLIATRGLKLKATDSNHDRVIVRLCAVLYVVTAFAKTGDIVHPYLIVAVHMVFTAWINLDKSKRQEVKA